MSTLRWFGGRTTQQCRVNLERRFNMLRGDRVYLRWFGSTHRGINADDRQGIRYGGERGSRPDDGSRHPRVLLNRSVRIRATAAVAACATAVLPLAVTSPALATASPAVSVTPLVD